MAEDQAQRTEPATPRKREEARRKGQVAQSRDLQSLAVLAAATLLLAATGLATLEALARVLRAGFGAASLPPSTGGDLHATILQSGIVAGLPLVPFLIGIPVLAGLAQLAFVGPLFSGEALQLRWDRLDPVQGFKRLVKLDRWVDLVKSLAKVVCITGVVWWVVQDDLASLLDLASASVRESAVASGWLLLKVAGATLLVIALIALIDMALQTRRYEKQLRMTQREVREDLKQVEGDPQIRSRYRSRQQELSRTRMIAAVGTADVVVTNPTHLAVALKYDREQMTAPQVVAKGRDRVAERIREAAKAARVPIVEDKPLARILHRTCEIGREIPENLFQAVAELLALVYRVEGARGRGW